MEKAQELRSFFAEIDYEFIIAADGETRTHKRSGDGSIVEQTPAGGVSVAFDVLCQAAGATYVGRARTDEDGEVVDPNGCVEVGGDEGRYLLKRVFLTPEEAEGYYAGYSNQTLWPLCHTAFQRPIFDPAWYMEYERVNRKFAESITEEMGERTFVWVNDYQLALVPGMLPKRENTVIGMFWHIPWPTWEVFRILPQKREILESILACDFVAFHRRYQARNFLNAVERELGARIDLETSTVEYAGKRTRVTNLPMGIDVAGIQNRLSPPEGATVFESILSAFGMGNGNSIVRTAHESSEDEELAALAERYDVVLGVDRLDYTKGIPERLAGIECFFERNPQYRGKVVYAGIMSPTRDAVPAYQELREQVEARAREINERFGDGEWEPLHMRYNGAARENVMDLYHMARVCLVTPLDDGMNLVSKEFVVAASLSEQPGMLVLSQWAGSAIDLTAALLVNPYDPEAVAAAIKLGLEMPVEERRRRIESMVELLEERNVYQWAMSFIRGAVRTVREQEHDVVQVM
jgi:trehalose 6-phosphate synthase/phosphatase